MIAMKIVYAVNILVAGWIGLVSIFSTQRSALTIFSGAYPSSELAKLVGCLWLAIAALSALGLLRPYTFSPVLLLQLIYKGTWLLVVALPAIREQKPFPLGMALFFLIWCLALPWVIPIAHWFKSN